MIINDKGEVVSHEIKKQSLMLIEDYHIMK